MDIKTAVACPLKIPNTKILASLGRGRQTLNYQASRDNRSFALKILLGKSTLPAENDPLHTVQNLSSDILQPPAQGARDAFVREAAFSGAMRHDVLPKVFEVGERDGIPYTLLEYLDGERLDSRLEGGPLSLVYALHLTREVASFLERLHSFGLVHGEIRPTNIVIGRDSLPRIYDLGMVGMLPNGAHRLSESTFAGYVAPEGELQAGRPWDHRIDLYSLGAFLVHSLSGELPPHFTPSQSSEHRAWLAMYRGLLAEKFGSDVAELTARLLEPLPEKRFNDAASLQEALLEIEPSLRGIEKNNEKDNASSRTTTSSGNRSKVWAVLPDYREDFQRMADWSLGKQNFAEDLLFVSGGVGVGKSSLLGALSERVSDAEGMAIEMSCKAGSAGLQCMQEALRTLVADQSERGKAIATKINAALDAVGDDGRLRKILFFQTTEFSVSTHSRGDDEEDDFSERFIKRIVSFLRKLSEEETLVSLLIDDVDNIDSLTSSVLEKLLQEPLPDSMNIVGTILDDRLLRFRERWLGSDSDNRSSVIRLANISRSSIQRIIEQELRGASVSPELIELIERHAAGNVAAAREYLRGLLHEGAILPYWGRWRLDRNRLLNADLPTGLKALQEHRLSHLPEETLDFLAAILCLGNEFDLEIAEIIFEEPVSQILSKLRPAFDAQLIRTESYSKIKVVHENLSRRLSFRLSAERRQDIHHRAALAFDEKTSPKNNFALKAANHFLLGRPSENIERAYNIYLSASAASIGLYSWEEARVYLYAAESLTGEDYPATLDLFESLALVHSRLGHPEEAAKHYLLAVELAKSAEDKVELRLRRAKVLIGVREASRAKEELERCLDILGHSLPDQSLSSWFISLARWAGAGLMFLLRYKFGFLGKKGKRRLELLVRTYLKLFYVGYLQQNSSAMLQSTLRALHAGSRLGRQSPFFTDAQVNYALLISGAGYQKKANRILSKAEETAESIKDKHLKARISVAKSMSLHIAGHASEAEENSWKTLKLYSQNLSSEDYFNASSDLSYNLFLRGYTRQSYEVMLRVFDRYGDSAGRGTSSLEQIFSHYLSAAEYILGMNTRAFERIEHALVELVSADTERFFIGDITAYLSIFAAESGDERLKIEDIQDARQSLEQTPSRTIYYQRHYYVFESWYWVRQLEKSQGGAEAASLLSHLRKSLHLLGQVLSTDVMRSHYLILLAWAEVYSGALNKGTRISEKACHMATRADNRWVLYEVALLRSVVARELYSEASAQTHAAMAHGIAVQQGWFNRQIKLEEEFDSLVKNRAFSRTPKRANETLSESSQAASELQRNLDAMMEASLTLAKPDSAVVQARRVLDIVLRLLGAERGAFLVPDGNSYFEVRACYDFESYKAATSTFAFDRALVEQVLDQRESQVVLAASPESAVNLKSGGGPRNIAAVPVERGQHLLGVVYIERRASDGTFSASDLQVLKAFASFLAVAIEAADVSDLEADFEAERTRRRVAEELSILSRDLVAARSARDIAAILARHLPHTMGTHNVAALVFREDGIERIAQTGIFSDIDPPDDLLGSLSMLERKKLENSSHITWEWHEGMRGMPYWLQKCLNVWDRGAVMALPIASRKHVLGVVFLANKDEESFGSSLSGFAEAIVHQTSGAVQGIRLMEEIARLAATDDLTGVSNRRHFFMLGEREIARAQRHNSTLTALMVDVDHFKAINDEHGHLVGDVVLKEIAKRMSDNLRTIDVIGRYGGEEFAILLPDANLDVAKKVIAEELRLAVCAQPIDGGSASVTVTISVGVAELDDQTSSLEALIGRADMAMYQAKERGRNRIVTEKEI